MKEIVKQMLGNKQTSLPILSFPAAKQLGVSVLELVTNSDQQANAMQMVAKKPVSAALNMMDLSVEAEAFGAEIRFLQDEIPTVVRPLLTDLAEAECLKLPSLSAGRTGVYIAGIQKAKAQIAKPVFAGAIGPFSLAGRLYDMSELMMECYDRPDLVHTLLKTCTTFITHYIGALKAAGADGVILAEPAAGLLSPALCEEFSSSYVKQIVEAVGDESFVFVYHNCGNTVPLVDGLVSIGADIYHFGNAVDLEEILKRVPKDIVVMGNLDPIYFKERDAAFVFCETWALLERLAGYENFTISSGCDIPADSNWESIDAYFAAICSFYGGKDER